MRDLGLLDMKHLLIERQSDGAHSDARAVLTFGQERRGLTAWLARPAPMGSLDFVTPEATLVAGVLMQDATVLVDDLFEMLGSSMPDFETRLAEFEQEHGINIREDVAAPLGGEFTFAVDGPLIPIPSWKLVLEVYNPAQLQEALVWAVEQLNQLTAEFDRKGFALNERTIGGRTFHQLESLDTGLTFNYTFVDGYMIAGPTRALLDRAIRAKTSGVNLAHDDRFIDLLPTDSQLNFSAVGYQNLGALLGPLTRLGEAIGQLSPNQQQMVEELSAESKPSLTLAYGDTDRITLVYTHEGGFFSSGLATFMSLQSLSEIPDLFGRTIQQGGS